MIIDIDSGVTVSPSVIRRANPNISLPRNPSDDTLAALGYAHIQPATRPPGDVVRQGQPEERDGVWYQTWEAREFTAEEKAAQLEAKRRGMVVSKAKAHIALHNAGLYQQVVDMMADPATDPVAVIAWNTASEYSRLSPNLLAVKDGIGLTDEQLDDLFEQAAQITP